MALPDFDPASDVFQVPASNNGKGSLIYSLPNPLQVLWKQLYSVVETKMSIIHGDLNLQNILVDDPTGFAWLIDFAETRVGPTLLDLQRLEVQVITKLMPLHGQIELGEMVDVMNRLHADPPLPPPQNPNMSEPYTLLVTIRRLARQYLIDDLNWNEYYYGLITALVGSLKYDELDNLTRAVSFVAAGAASDLVGKRMRSSYPITAAYSAHGRAVTAAGSGRVDSFETGWKPYGLHRCWHRCVVASSRWHRWLVDCRQDPKRAIRHRRRLNPH